MDEKLEKLIAQIREEDKLNPLAEASENLHRRMAIASRIAKNIFGEGNPDTVFALYEYLIKEQVAVAWGKAAKAKAEKDSSLIEEYPIPMPGGGKLAN